MLFAMTTYQHTVSLYTQSIVFQILGVQHMESPFQFDKGPGKEQEESLLTRSCRLKDVKYDACSPTQSDDTVVDVSFDD